MKEDYVTCDDPFWLQVIVADTDELFTYGTATLKEAIAEMEADGASYALGEMLDHVSRNGSITELKVHNHYSIGKAVARDLTPHVV